MWRLSREVFHIEKVCRLVTTKVPSVEAASRSIAAMQWLDVGVCAEGLRRAGVHFAAALGGGEGLAGVEALVGAESRLEARHRCHVVVAEDPGHEVALLQAHAMLAGDAAA